jgi:hypothetical protein
VLINVFINMLAFQQADLYRSWRGRPYSDQFSRLLMAWALAAVPCRTVTPRVVSATC